MVDLFGLRSFADQLRHPAWSALLGASAGGIKLAPRGSAFEHDIRALMRISIKN